MTTRLKIFNLDEANALLPEVDSLLTVFEAKQEAFRRLHDELFFAELVDDVSPAEDRLQALEEVLMDLEEEMGKIRSLGCFLRHSEQGRVDFLAQKGQERIYYCWQRGEKQIQFYHSLRGGFFERRPI